MAYTIEEDVYSPMVAEKHARLAPWWGPFILADVTNIQHTG